MIKGDKNIDVIDFSEIFYSAFHLEEQFCETISPCVFFIANKEGQMVIMKEIGVVDPNDLEIINCFPNKIELDHVPYKKQDYLIDAIPLTLRVPNNYHSWDGYLGIIIAVIDTDPKMVRPLLFGLKQSLVMTSKYIAYKNDTNYQVETFDRMIIQILKETDYTDEFPVFAEAFLNEFKKMFSEHDFLLTLLNRNEDLLRPCYATSSFVLSERYLLRTEDINKLLMTVEDRDCVNVITKRVANENGILVYDECFEDFVLIPIEYNQLLWTVLVCGKKHGKIKSDHINIVVEIIEKVKKLIYKLLTYEKKQKDQKRKELLLQLTKKFHSTMDVSAILAEIINASKQVFSTFEIQLLLSHEWEVGEDLPVQQLSYSKDTTNEMATNAYLTGKIHIERLRKGKNSIVYAPLRGKQGVYGVLKIIGRHSSVFKNHEIEFIEVLADTGGNAIENAELYQQSRQLVEDLQLINKTAHQLNLNLRLSETINYMTKQIKLSFNAQEIGFFMFRKNGQIKVIEGSTKYFLKESSTEEIAPFFERIKMDMDALFIGDLASQEPHLLRPFRSFIAVPMVQKGELKGAVIIVHEHAYHFSFNKFKLLQSLIHHSTLAFTNSMLHEELEKLVITDHLTRLYARNFLDERINESMEKDAYGCFLLIDIDNFKEINDIHGHQIGDDIIIQVANVLKENIKNTDIAARWGGEELAVYLPKADKQVGELVAQRIRKKVKEITNPTVTISCGVSDWKQIDRDKSLKTLFRYADQALYKAKRSGKNAVVIYGDDIVNT
ncbi:sensor domain-containing diguanylate cyclase [Anaerobacillus alkalidiazotrophicus]|uniref:sensor domain-containing diguanylate cyclase n=1 Tax=Anaerobacillus alkalidiazotrophicus TaxID=472963 RepID=UPI000B01A7F0|nr:diguanylate cyclase [Anaerobacillus alkalidiazotrophicus]